MLVLLVACGMLVADRVNRFPMVGAFLGTHFGVLTFIALWVDPDLVREAYRPAAGQPCHALTRPRAVAPTWRRTSGKPGCCRLLVARGGSRTVTPGPA